MQAASTRDNAAGANERGGASKVSSVTGDDSSGGGSGGGGSGGGGGGGSGEGGDDRTTAATESPRPRNVKKQLYQRQLEQTEAQLKEKLRQLLFVTNTKNEIAKPPPVQDGKFTL